MDMVDMDTMDIMVRGLQRLSLDMDIMVMDMVMDTDMDMGMVTMDTMARGLLSQDTDIMAMDMDMDIMDMVMAMDMDTMVMDTVMDTDMDMGMVTMDTMARGPLSQDTDIMAMDMDIDIMDMVMAMDMDTMVRMKAKCCYFLEFSTPEVDHNRSSQNKHTC